MSAARLLLAPLFGAGMGLSFAAGWFFLGRGLTPRVWLAVLFIGAAAALSGILALGTNHVLRRKPWSARVAAALIMLIAGTGALASSFLMLRTVTMFHDLTEVPVWVALIVMGISGLGALYSVLAVAAPLMLPLALPLIGFFATLIARDPR